MLLEGVHLAFKVANINQQFLDAVGASVGFVELNACIAPNLGIATSLS